MCHHKNGDSSAVQMGPHSKLLENEQGGCSKTSSGNKSPFSAYSQWEKGLDADPTAGSTPLDGPFSL